MESVPTHPHIPLPLPLSRRQKDTSLLPQAVREIQPCSSVIIARCSSSDDDNHDFYNLSLCVLPLSSCGLLCHYQALLSPPFQFSLKNNYFGGSSHSYPTLVRITLWQPWLCDLPVKLGCVGGVTGFGWTLTPWTPTLLFLGLW